MASTHPNPAPFEANPVPAGGLLVSLAALPVDGLEAMLANLALAFPHQNVVVATPDNVPKLSSGSPLHLVPYVPSVPSSTPWFLTAADFVNTYKLAHQHNASACLILGAESQSLQPTAIHDLASAALASDLAVAHYNLGPREGLVNSAILYPVTRALFSASPRYPLALDLGTSIRMSERLAAAAQRFTASNQNDALIWPVAEAATASFSVAEVDTGTRAFAVPNTDLNTLLSQITGSLFSEIEAKASFWQRARSLPRPRPASPPSSHPPEGHADIAPMLEAFRLAYTNLHEIWSLVLPPNSLLGLKRLSVMPPENFRMPDSLWARIVYDFALAYRLRTINRGHLLGALTPLYLAWVASHLTLVNSGTAPEAHIQELAATFETDKPYLVSRWRWPDRFNP